VTGEPHAPTILKRTAGIGRHGANLVSRVIVIFVARQPIFDRDEQVAGYELLYRSNGEVGHATGSSTLQMSSDVLVHAFLGLGIDRLTHGVPAFVNFPDELLAQEYYTLLDPKSVVIEVLETVPCTAETMRVLERMAARGYQIALDDFELDASRFPFLELADIVKLDVLNKSDEELARMVEALSAHEVRLLAERVETADVLACCRALGFELFQGYHFARPETLSKREMPVEQLQTIRLMNLLHDPKTTDTQLEEALRTNLPVAYRLLRIVSSAAIGGRGIQSIQHAVRLVGRDALHRWLGLVLVSSVATDGGAAVERVHAALRAARMCELLAARAGRTTAAGPLFLVGLLSRLDVLFRMPMPEIVARMDLAPEVRAALLGEGGPYAEPLRLVEAYDNGCWDDVSQGAQALGVAAEDLPELYVNALAWAHEQLPLARP
jgi:EAL and modified HD-GYP domain-containing signal transduction protein